MEEGGIVMLVSIVVGAQIVLALAKVIVGDEWVARTPVRRPKRP